MTYEKAMQLRQLIEELVVNLTDEEALTGIELFPHWEVGVNYKVNDRISYNDKLYKVVQAHTSQADWTPAATPALFIEMFLPDTIPVWHQSTGAHDVYQKDDKVFYPTANDSIYISLIDNNVWAPDVYGWQLLR